jgi:hypothetical protein
MSANKSPLNMFEGFSIEKESDSILLESTKVKEESILPEDFGKREVKPEKAPVAPAGPSIPKDETDEKVYNPRGLRRGPRTSQKKTTVSFSIDICLQEVFEEYCIDEDISKSKVANDAFKYYIEEKLGLKVDWDKYRLQGRAK